MLQCDCTRLLKIIIFLVVLFIIQHFLMDLFIRNTNATNRNVYLRKKYPGVVALNNSLKKRILVTGGAGFIGSHLVDELMVYGNEVIVIDDLSTGKKENIAHWFGHENFEFIQKSILSTPDLRIDQIYHLADSSLRDCNTETMKTNILGLMQLLNLSKKINSRILIASSSDVYGNPDMAPQTEAYWGFVNPIGPRSGYEEVKRMIETLTYVYAKQEGIKVRVARIYQTYGPRMNINDDSFVSNFIKQSLKNDTITIFGNGRQTRSLLFITDLIRGLRKVMESNHSLPFNLGNPIEQPIGDFAIIIREFIGSSSKLVYAKPREDDPRSIRPNIFKAKKIIKWEPRVSVSGGLEKTIEYFRQQL